MTNYDVGQILFVLNARKMSITPVQVAEQLVKRTRLGEQISYMVTMQSSSGEQIVSLEELQGDVYVTLDDVRITMKKNAEAAIDKMILHAREIASQIDPVFGVTLANQATPENGQIIMPNNNEDNETKLITLPDGTVARLKNSSLFV